jgi:hypothetical protein
MLAFITDLKSVFEPQGFEISNNDEIILFSSPRLSLVFDMKKNDFISPRYIDIIGNADVMNAFVLVRDRIREGRILHGV